MKKADLERIIGPCDYIDVSTNQIVERSISFNPSTNYRKLVEVLLNEGFRDFPNPRKVVYAHKHPGVIQTQVYFSHNYLPTFPKTLISSDPLLLEMEREIEKLRKYRTGIKQEPEMNYEESGQSSDTNDSWYDFHDLPVQKSITLMGRAELVEFNPKLYDE